MLAGHAGVARERIDVVLDEVRLLDRAGDRVAGYSLGMKQRLGVAAALLKDPELLILDEPTNGLDPSGMAEMRTLIRSLGQGERTVVLSSHLMGEVEQISDRVGVIRAGRAGRRGHGRRAARPGRPAGARAAAGGARATLLARQPGVEAVAREDGALAVTADPALAADLNRALVTAGVAVSELTTEQSSLEDVFFALTEGEAA